MQTESGKSIRRHRILVVDDYPDTADALCSLLTMLGHECHSARNGGEALDEARRFDPDIAIIDIGLPDISGYDVARALRTCASNRSLHLAAVTGWGQPADRERALSAGFDQHVVKPVNAQRLRDMILVAERAQGADESSHADSAPRDDQPTTAAHH